MTASSHPTFRSVPSITSFIVRVWCTEPEGQWRCLLIEVESGERLVCKQLEQIGASIADWLSSHPPPRQKGIR